MGAFQKNLLDEFFQRCAILPPRFGRVEPGIYQYVRTLNDLPAEDVPIAGSCNRQIYINSVAGEIWPIRGYIMMAHAHSFGFFSMVPVVMWKIPEPCDGRVKHRDVDDLAGTRLLPLIKS